MNTIIRLHWFLFLFASIAIFGFINYDEGRLMVFLKIFIGIITFELTCLVFLISTSGFKKKVIFVKQRAELVKGEFELYEFNEKMEQKNQELNTILKETKQTTNKIKELTQQIKNMKKKGGSGDGYSH